MEQRSPDRQTFMGNVPAMSPSLLQAYQGQAVRSGNSISSKGSGSSDV